MKQQVETAFLPAALEIQETPPSPIGRGIQWAILVFCLIAVAWAALSHVDIVAVARGHIIPNGHSKTVQPLEIGSVVAIHVADGQTVSAGDLLIELDPATAQADVERLKHLLEDAQREERRAARLLQWVAAPPSADKTHEAVQAPLLASQWQEYQSRLAVLIEERQQQLAEYQSAQRLVEKLQAILPIATERAEGQKTLAQRKLLAQQQYLEAEQQRLETLHDLLAQKAHASESQRAVDAIQARIVFTENEFRRQLQERKDKASQQASALRQELAKAESLLKARTLRAPVDGVVQQLAVHNVGAVVTPAQQLLVIVPRGEQLEVEAVLENKDIGFVSRGQLAEVKIDTFPFTQYGTIAASVAGISDDAVPDEQQGLVYKMRVALDQSKIWVNNQWVSLTPGMTVTVEAKTGSRRLIEYFLSPLLRYRNESVRER